LYDGEGWSSKSNMSIGKILEDTTALVAKAQLAQKQEEEDFKDYEDATG
jgi:hypothetical protein